MHPDIFVLSLLPLAGGLFYLFRPTRVKEINRRARDAYNPGAWIPEDMPMWLLRLFGFVLIFIAACVMRAAFR